jgi:phenylacetate-CoA ligase
MSTIRRLANSAWLAAAAARERRIPFLRLEQIERLQRRRLRRMVRYAWERVPFWRAAMQQRGLVPDDIATPNDLARLPLVDERTVQLRLEEFRSPNWPDSKTFVLKSGGARTRLRKTIHWDPASQLRKLAWQERDRAVLVRLAGREVGLRQLWILPEASESLRARAWFDARVATPRALVARERIAIDLRFGAVLERLAEFRPQVVYSYGSYAERFFRWLDGAPTPSALPRVWVYGGDAMDPIWRERAETRGCLVLSTYQSVEAGRIGFECERRQGFHLNIDLVAVRVLDADGRDVGPGTVGEIVISNLVNRATVLLNARLGDRGALAAGGCPCGRSLPLLQQLEGRTTELIELLDGRRFGDIDLRKMLASALDFALQVQVVHPRPGQIVWRVVPRRVDEAQAHAARLADRTRETLGASTEVSVEVVDDIPPAPSGKAMRVERTRG